MNNSNSRSKNKCQKSDCGDGKGKARVLVVDRTCESAEVLEAMLQRQGVGTYRARQASEGIQLARTCEPDVIVLDVDSLDDEAADASDFADFQDGATPRLVMLGSVRHSGKPAPSVSILPKPYHYAALLRKIEMLLNEVRAA